MRYYKLVITIVISFTVNLHIYTFNKTKQYKGEINMISVNMTVKDVFNAKRASTPVEAVIGTPIKVKGFALAESPDANGEVKEVGYVVEEGTNNVFGFVSDICKQGINDLYELYNQDASILDGLVVTFKKSLSKSGREFYYMHIS